MAGNDSGDDSLMSSLPPGFRFHPTEEELVNHYSKKKIHDKDPQLDSFIPEINLDKFEPWDLPQISRKSNNEWLFFNQLEHKWNNSKRIKRGTKEGRWKSTGKKRDIKDENSSLVIGTRKILTYYLRGLAKKDLETKTDWVLHDYHNATDDSNCNHNQRKLVLCHLKKYSDESTPIASTHDASHETSTSSTNYSLLISRLPVGFRFHPTKVELVEYYLRNKIQSNGGMDSAQVDSIISEINIYEFEPWELPERLLKCFSASNEDYWFFFTSLERYKNTKNTRRATKLGTWKSIGKEYDVIKQHNDVIGKRKFLTFYSAGQVKSKWIMHEYSLVSHVYNQGDLVLCKLKKNADDEEKEYDNDNIQVIQQEFSSTEEHAKKQSPKNDCNCLYSSTAADDHELTEIVNSILFYPEPDSYTYSPFNHSNTLQI